MLVQRPRPRNIRFEEEHAQRNTENKTDAPLLVVGIDAQHSRVERREVPAVVALVHHHDFALEIDDRVFDEVKGRFRSELQWKLTV